MNFYHLRIYWSYFFVSLWVKKNQKLKWFTQRKNCLYLNQLLVLCGCKWMPVHAILGKTSFRHGKQRSLIGMIHAVPVRIWNKWAVRTAAPTTNAIKMTRHWRIYPADVSSWYEPGVLVWTFIFISVIKIHSTTLLDHTPDDRFAIQYTFIVHIELAKCGEGKFNIVFCHFS